MDCLFIHVPRIRKEFSQIMVLPMGLFSLANEIDLIGISTKILHYGLKILDQPTFDIINYIKESNVKIVALDLHWHYQLVDVVRLSRRIKKNLPHIKIIVGGYTASCFYSEIMNDLKFIDFVIRGDAELPLVELCNHILHRMKTNLKDIPNLVWRDGGRINTNKLSYQNNKENTKEFCHSNIDLLIDNKNYFSNKVLYGDFNLKPIDNKRDVYFNCFFYNVGKGCPVNCSYCGGSNTSQKKLFNRDSYFFYEFDKVINDLKTVFERGIGTWRTCFDPDIKRTYYIKLFEYIKKLNLNFKSIFDCWSLPNEEFIHSFKRTFDSKSILTISADCGSDIVRRKNRGFVFTNRELLNVVDTLLNESINVHIYFSYGLPFEKKQDLSITKNIVVKLKSMGTNCSVIPMYLDPYSPIFLDPEKFSVKLKCDSVKDFYLEHKGTNRNVNYSTNYLSEEEIQEGCDYLTKFC